MSAFTLGTVQLGLPYGIANRSGKPDRRTAFRILRTALDAGISVLDTASRYGDAEEVLGEYFAAADGGVRPCIVTKLAVDQDRASSPAAVEKEIRSQVERSLDRLRISRIPVYLLHMAGDMDRYGRLVPDTLRKLKVEGLIGMAGVSVYTPAEAERMLADDIYEAIQIPFNILDTRLIRSGVLRRLAAADRLVFARSVFLQGLFFVKPESLPENLMQASVYLERLAGLAEEEGMTIAQLALSYARDTPGITSLVIGCETEEQVRQNAALFTGTSVSDRTRAAAERFFADVPEKTLNPAQWNAPSTK